MTSRSFSLYAPLLAQLAATLLSAGAIVALGVTVVYLAAWLWVILEVESRETRSRPLDCRAGEWFAMRQRKPKPHGRRRTEPGRGHQQRQA
ncbi:hypothetical protein BH18ACT15_BH18ACT15_14390 [soil metagenome]